MRVHDLQAYRRMDVTRERISRILELTPTRHKSLLKGHADAYQSADTNDQFNPNTEY